MDESTQLVTTTLCDASRQTDGKIFGLLDYCTIWDGHTRVDACHAAGSENDQVRKFWQADPAPQDEDSTRPEDQGQGSEEQQRLIECSIAPPRYCWLRRDRMFQAPGPGGGRAGEVGLGLLDSAARKKVPAG